MYVWGCMCVAVYVWEVVCRGVWGCVCVWVYGGVCVAVYVWGGVCTYKSPSWCGPCAWKLRLLET